MRIISLSGVKDSSFLLGHNYTYVESKCGTIIQNVINSEVLNPIMYFDELDKISTSDQGQDIFSVLCNLTDDTLNSSFTDHYLGGIRVDLSRVFYIFTFNDISKINKILLDRLNIIYIETPSRNEKCIILQKFCLPDVLYNIGIQNSINFDTECFMEIIDYVEEQIDMSVSSGIRECVRILEKILLEVNKEIVLNDIVFNTIDYNSFKVYFSKLKKQFFINDVNKKEIPFNMYI